MLKGFKGGHLSCGCRFSFRAGVVGSPVTVVIAQKAAGCRLTLHVENFPVYDFREALRPANRLSLLSEGEYEGEG